MIFSTRALNCSYEQFHFICKWLYSCGWSAYLSMQFGGQRQCQTLLPQIFLQPNKSLSQVCQPQPRLRQELFRPIHSFTIRFLIQDEPWPLFLFLFFISHLTMWQNCGQVGGQVCPLIQNDKFSLGLLPRDRGLPGLTGRASYISGRPGTEPDLAPRSGD